MRMLLQRGFDGWHCIILMEICNGDVIDMLGLWCQTRISRACDTCH